MTSQTALNARQTASEEGCPREDETMPTLFIDADACPVTREAIDAARRHKLPCVIAGDSGHNLMKHVRKGVSLEETDGFWVRILQVGQGKDSADFCFFAEEAACHDTGIHRDVTAVFGDSNFTANAR